MDTTALGFTLVCIIVGFGFLGWKLGWFSSDDDDDIGAEQMPGALLLTHGRHRWVGLLRPEQRWRPRQTTRDEQAAHRRGVRLLWCGAHIVERAAALIRYRCAAGGKTDRYVWTQTNHDVEVRFPVDEGQQSARRCDRSSTPQASPPRTFSTSSALSISR